MPNKKILILLFSIFLDILGFSFILPIIPFIIEWFWGNSFVVWAVISATAAWMFIWGIFFWKLSDKYPRKNVLLITIWLNILWYLIFWLSTNLTIFFVARFLCGLWGGWISVVQAYISDISSEEDRIKNMWLVGASIGLGFTLWPIFWALLSGMKLNEMWYISAFILLVSFGLILVLLENQSKWHVEESLNIKWASKNLVTLFFTFFVVTATFAGIQTIFSLFLNQNFDLSIKQIWLTFWYIWIIAIIYQAFFINSIYKKIWEKNMILSWLFLSFLWLFLIGINTKLVILYLILPLFAIWISNTNSAIYSLVTHNSHKKDFGKNMWINTAFWSMADIAWPLLSGTLFLASRSLPFYIFWILLFLNIFFVYFLLKQK